MSEISVIVPVYNSKTFLKECVESVVAQSFDDWELILVDDGSTDGSDEVCLAYADSDDRIQMIRKGNGGVSSARNAGLDNASGKYVFFLDADDELYPDAFAHLHNIAETRKVPIVIGRHVNAVSKPAAARTYSSEKEGGLREAADNVRIVDSRQLCIDTLYQKPGTDTSVCWHLYNRSLFDGIRFFEGGRYEDLEIFHKLLMRTMEAAITDRVVYFYRDHASSFINSWSAARRDIVPVAQGIVDTYRNDKELRHAASVRLFSANYNLLLALLRYRPQEKEEISRCYRAIRQLRRSVLLDSSCRRKDRAGALLSYLGVGSIKMLS